VEKAEPRILLIAEFRNVEGTFVIAILLDQLGGRFLNHEAREG
jgi:hypothetical protein